MWDIRPERPEDENAIEDLVRQGFGAGRFAKTAYRLREGVLPVAELGFVAEAHETHALSGSVRFWPVRIAGQDALLLGPLAVGPALRGKGVGVALMQKGIEAARAHQYGAIILVGDEPYYAKVGFAKLKRGQLRFPGPVDQSRILGLALRDGALDALEGQVMRAKINVPVAAHAAALG